MSQKEPFFQTVMKTSSKSSPFACFLLLVICAELDFLVGSEIALLSTFPIALSSNAKEIPENLNAPHDQHISQTP